MTQVGGADVVLVLEFEFFLSINIEQLIRKRDRVPDWVMTGETWDKQWEACSQSQTESIQVT